jgi:integrase
MTGYEEWLIRHGRAQKTIDGYMWTINKYLDFCKGIPSKDTLEQYIEKLIEGGAESSSVQRHYFAIRSFFKYLDRENEVKDIVLPKVNSKESRYIKPDEVQKILAVAHHPTDRLIIRLIFDGALRASELLKLTVEDFTASPGYIRIMGSKRRGPNEADYIPVDDVIIADLKRYLKHMNITKGPIFNVEYQALYQRIKRLCRSAKIDAYSPHAFRHGRGTQLAITDRADIYDLRDFMRHKSIQTTMRYVHVAPEVLKKRIKPSMGVE